MSTLEENSEIFEFVVRNSLNEEKIGMRAVRDNTLHQVFELLKEETWPEISVEGVFFENEYGKISSSLDVTLGEFGVHEGSVLTLEIFVEVLLRMIRQCKKSYRDAKFLFYK